LQAKSFPRCQPRLDERRLSNDIARACCDAPIIKQLETLDLSMGTMTDEGATAIVENAAHFKHLKKLNLDENFISDDAQKALEKALGDIVAIGDQEEPDDDYVYVSVGE
jgi:Ran GTPase-activating protein (RanGAP) involved in mRNA processing and transport